MDIIILLSILLIVIIIMTACPKENFIEKNTNFQDKDSLIEQKPLDDKSISKPVEIIQTDDETIIEKEDKSKNTSQHESKKNKEKYYDYKYTYNAGPSPQEIKNVTREVINEKDERPININISYPPQPNQLNDDRVVYYDTTLLQNLSGNPVDQVETDYSVIEDDTMYRSWDKYYLPGYSYFPPSKWQLPRDNALIVPRELRDENCEVCPLVANNGTNNYLSGDILKGNTIKQFPKKEITKYVTVNKGMNGIGGKGTKIVRKVKKT